MVVANQRAYYLWYTRNNFSLFALESQSIQSLN